MRWLKSQAAVHKLLISILILTVINIDIYSLFTTTKIKENTVEAEQSLQKEQPKPSELEIRKLKLELALRQNKNAIRFLGEDIPRVSIKAIDLCEKYKNEGLTIPTLMGIMQVESGFNPRAISETNAYGLMQVVRSTATPILNKMGYKWSVKQMLHPETNMEVGTIYLMGLHKQFMSLGWENKNEFHTSVLAYYYGEGMIISSVREESYISLSYLGKVKISTRKWEALGL